MASIIAFCIALLLLVLFFVFKIFEQSRDFALYTQYRVYADNVVLEATKNIHERIAQFTDTFSFKNISHFVVHRSASTIAHVARKVESKAQNVTRKMSRNGNGQARITKSPFFEKVVTHKNGLDTERVKRETSLTNSEE